MNGRTPYQQTLLGDDAGSEIAWKLYMAGYERGVQAGHAAGYLEGIDVLRDAMGLLQTYDMGRHDSFKELTRKREAKLAEARAADTRTGEQLQADAAASWGLTTTRKDAAA